MVLQERWGSFSCGGRSTKRLLDERRQPRNRRSTQSLLGDLRRRWQAQQAQHTELPGRDSARVAPTARAALHFAWQAGTVHKASWTSRGARGRHWGHDCCRVAGATQHSTLLSPRPPLITSHSSPSNCHSPSSTHHLAYVTHHSPRLASPLPLPHPNSSQHHSLITGPLLLTINQSSTSQTSLSHITTHHSSTFHNIFHKPSSLGHTIFYTPSFTHTTLSPTIFDTPSFTHQYATRKSFTHIFVTHPLSHTTFHSFVTHDLSHTISHTSCFTRTTGTGNIVGSFILFNSSNSSSCVPSKILNDFFQIYLIMWKKNIPNFINHNIFCLFTTFIN